MSRGITRSAPSDRSGSAALALTVGISLSMAVGGVFLMRTANQSLKAVILAEKEAELINYAKKKAMLTGVTTPSPCATQTPLPSFTPDSDDPTQEWRCFTTPSGTGTETILQARKATAAAPDAPPPLVVTVTVPQAATACAAGDDAVQRGTPTFNPQNSLSTELLRVKNCTADPAYPVLTPTLPLPAGVSLVWSHSADPASPVFYGQRAVAPNDTEKLNVEAFVDRRYTNLMSQISWTVSWQPTPPAFPTAAPIGTQMVGDAFCSSLEGGYSVSDGGSGTHFLGYSPLPVLVPPMPRALSYVVGHSDDGGTNWLYSLPIHCNLGSAPGCAMGNYAYNPPRWSAILNIIPPLTVRGATYPKPISADPCTTVAGLARPTRKYQLWLLPVVTPTCSVHSGGSLVGTQAAADAAIYDKNDSTSCFGGGMSNGQSQTVITATLQFAAPIAQVSGMDVLAWRGGSGIQNGYNRFRVQINGTWSSPMDPDSSMSNGSYSNPMMTYTKNGPWLNVSAIEIEVKVLTVSYAASSAAKIYEFRFW